MKMKVGLETVVKEMPETVKRGSDYSYLEHLIPKDIQGKFRFPDEIRRFRHDDAAEILAERVAKKALDRAGLKTSDIDYIIANNCGGKYTVPMVGTYIHHKLGCSKETPVLNISNACASFVDGCQVAWNIILGGRYKRILVVTVSAWETTGGQMRADLTDFLSVLMGDGAGAGIVSSQNLKCEFLSHYNWTSSEVYDWCGATPSKCVHPELKQANDQPTISNYLFGTPGLFGWWKNNGERYGIECINKALEMANLSLSQLDMVVFHQPSDLMYDFWIDGAEKAGLSRAKWKHTWNKYGNLSNSVIPVNLAEFWENGELKKDSIIALLSVGAGGHGPTIIIKWLV
jgi:3-oxoacyl-[acyl-carrier-protein] synthase-3